MPVNLLLVEGELDQQLLNAVYGGDPTAEAAGSKYALAPRVLDKRGKEREDIFYLRDRDYDTEPPEDIAKPTEEFRNRQRIGWCWCRHSIENYMLDPAIVCPALRVAEEEYLSVLTSAALSIRYYQAARWTIGTVRCGLLPPYKLDTQEEKAEFYLPPAEALENNAANTWVLGHIQVFADEVRPSLEPNFVDDVYTRYATRFENGFCNDLASILNWFSGKNLMAAFKDWCNGLDIKGPGDFRNRIRDWMIYHPEDILTTLPEWRALLEEMRSM